MNGADQLDGYEEARHQVALADVLILTKTDLAEPQAVAALSDRLRRINPGAEIVPVVHGAISPADLFERAPEAPSKAGDGAERWLKSEAFARERIGRA